MTFVIYKDNSPKEVKKTLFEGKTMVWFKELMIGKEEYLLEVVKANISASSPSYKYDELIAKVTLKNHSANTLHLKYTGPFTFHQDGTIFKIEPYGEKSLDVKTLEIKTSFELPFELLNSVIGRKKYLSFSIKTQ